MSLFRSVTVGLLGACLYFVLQLGVRPEPLIVTEREAMHVRESAPVPVTVVDVAHGVPATMVPGLVRIAPDEHIAAVDEQPAQSDLVAGALMLEHARSGGYVDLSIAAADGANRRVLVLLH